MFIFDDALNWLFAKNDIARPQKKDLAAWIETFKEATLGDRPDPVLLRHVVRRGIPDPLRGWAWARILGIDGIPFEEIERRYRRAFADTFGHGLAPREVCIIGSDTPSSSATNRVLAMISRQNPLLDSIMLLPSVLAILEEYFEGEEMCLAAGQQLVAMDIRRRRQGDLLGMLPSRDSSSLVQLLKQLLKIEAPALFSHLSLIDSSIYKSVLFSMLRNIYKDSRVPCRLLECWLVEGYKANIRFALAHLLLKEPELSLIPFNDTERIGECLLEPCKCPEKLAKTALLVHFSRKMLRRRRYSVDNVMSSDLSPFSVLCKFPRLAHRSLCVTKYDQWQTLWQWLPPRFQDSALGLLFSSDEHGRSLQYLFFRCALQEPLVMLVECEEDGMLLGAFLSKSLTCRPANSTTSKAYGTGETFVFSLHPHVLQCSWRPDPDNTGFVVSGLDNGIGVGVGSGGFALHVDKSLLLLRSSRSPVFGNDPLFGEDHRKISRLEVWGFMPC